MNFDAGYIAVRWTAPSDGYSNIQNYNLELGEFNTFAGTIFWRQALLTPLTGGDNQTT